MSETIQANNLELAHPNRVIVPGQEHEYDTNLPEGLMPVEVTDSRYELCLLPEVLEQLPEGEYYLKPLEADGIDDFDREFLPYVPPKEIGVYENELGKVVSRDSFADTDWFLGGGMSDVMTGLGYVVEDGRITAIPTPETLKRCAERMGVEVVLIEGAGMVSADEYLAVFAEGKYPVATGTEIYYKHDIEDDHITAMVMGGKPLRDALSVIAKSVLSGDDPETKRATTSRIDTFTATLRAVISSHKDLLGEAYGDEKGRKTFIDSAARLGIGVELAKEILRTAQENARELGVQVSELH